MRRREGLYHTCTDITEDLFEGWYNMHAKALGNHVDVMQPCFCLTCRSYSEV